MPNNVNRWIKKGGQMICNVGAVNTNWWFELRLKAGDEGKNGQDKLMRLGWELLVRGKDESLERSGADDTWSLTQRREKLFFLKKGRLRQLTRNEKGKTWIRKEKNWTWITWESKKRLGDSWIYCWRYWLEQILRNKQIEWENGLTWHFVKGF